MRRSGIAFGGVCAVTTVLSPLAAVAQEGGVLLTFGIENRLEVIRNEALSVPADGTDVANATFLSFGLRSETALDRLAFFASGAAIVENAAGDSGTELDFGRATVALDYRREVPSALLELNASLRNDDVGSFEDLAAADESGTQTDYGLAARLEIGRTSTVGLALGLEYEATDYQDVSDPDLVDTTEARADAAVILRFSEVATGRLGLRYSEREEETAGATVTRTLVSYAGLDYSVSERLDLSAEVGYAEIETEDFGLVERVTGPDLRLGATYDMPVGTLSALLRVTTDEDDDRRETFEIGRDMETPRDTISARLGVTRADTTGTDLVGSLLWDRDLPDGSLGLELAHRVSFDDDDGEIGTSIVSVTWLKNINEVSSISLDVAYEQSDSDVETIQQVSFGAGYSQQLTQDWNLDTGVEYRVRDDADGRARSPGVFVALSREFQVRP
ncbi:hypothetical protein [Tabrizicola sp.]|uniref:hypothetical protein n=1 Tax=Tabrizicola sp. TaxID=2005166 RepID=UPI00273771E6|nr:hypothetical protein [Tabrizicola sp.]MDP3194724.1 hypothetical protein [Tabrizicola sp.]